MASRQNGVVRSLRRFVDAIWGDPTLQTARRLQRRAVAESQAGRSQQALALQQEAIVLFRRVGSVMPQHRGDLAAGIAYLGRLQAAANQRVEAIDSLREAAGKFREFFVRDRRFGPHLWDALYRLGVEQHALARGDDALATFTEVVALGRDLKWAFDYWLESMAAALHYLAYCQTDHGEARAAHASMLEALGHYRELASDGKASSTVQLARAFATLSKKELRLGATREAVESAETAVNLFRSITPPPDDAPAGLADALASLAAAEGVRGRRRQALEAATEALALFRKLAAADPKFLPYLAYTLANLARDRCALGLYDRALESAHEELEIRRKLEADAADAGPVPAHRALACSLACLAFYQRTLDLSDAALEASTEAVELFETVAGNTDDLLAEKVGALASRAMSLARLGRSAEAYRVGQEAVALARPLVEASPATAGQNLAATLVYLSAFECVLGLRREGAASAAESVALCRKLAAEDPDRFLDDLAVALAQLSFARGELGAYEEALAGAAEAVAIWRRLAVENPDGTAASLAASLANLAGRQHDLGRFGEAWDSADEAVALWRQVAAAHAGAAGPWLPAALRHLARAERELGRAKVAVASASEAVSLVRGRLAENPGGYRPLLVKALEELARARLAAGDPDASLAAAEAIAVCRGLIAANRSGAIDDLADSLHAAAAIHGAAGRRDDARAADTEAAALYEELAAAFPEVFAGRLAAARARLTAL